MNSLIPKLMLSTAIAVTLGACASLQPESPPERDRLAQIHSGLTQGEVRRIAGPPNNVIGETTWIYSFLDTWGYLSEFDVSFDGSGLVSDTYSDHLKDD